MKCQRCPKQATLHITEVLGDDRFEEVHLCEECAKKYLYEPQAGKKSAPPKGGEGAAESDEPDSLGEKQCAACGLKFVEFRNNGRLGCPFDYDAFKADLIPLLESVHGETKHTGKSPQRPQKAAGSQIEIQNLRKLLQQVVGDEKYEDAARLRDKIREMEG